MDILYFYFESFIIIFYSIQIVDKICLIHINQLILQIMLKNVHDRKYLLGN